MSAVAVTTLGSRSQSQDFDLNLASIIDCLTVLIAFVLVSTSFVSIGILDAGVAAGGTTAAEGAPSPINLTIQLNANHTIGIKTTGKANQQLSVGALSNGEWDHAALTKRLEELKQKWPGLNAATLLAENTVPYRDVVKSMETARKTVPAILLGGF